MRLDACVPRKRKDQQGNEKTFWVKIGSIWTKDDGSVSCEFDALPVADSEGRVVVKGFIPKQKEGNAQPVANNAGSFNDLADDIPF